MCIYRTLLIHLSFCLTVTKMAQKAQMGESVESKTIFNALYIKKWTDIGHC